MIEHTCIPPQQTIRQEQRLYTGYVQGLLCDIVLYFHFAFRKGESSPSMRDHPWKGCTVTSSELGALCTVNPSIPATSAAVSWTPDGSVMMSGTVTNPLVKSQGLLGGFCPVPCKKSVIHPLMGGNRPADQNQSLSLFPCKTKVS